MKRILVYMASILLTFTFGVGAASFWNWKKYPFKNQQPSVNVLERCPTNQTDSTALTVISAPPATANRDVVFGGDRLRIVPDEVQLKSERLRYEIDVSYPQIVGTEHLHIRKLNQHIKKLATEQYQWPLNPSKADLRYYREKWPEVFNSLDLDYEVRLATDSLVSIYFIGYSYGIGAAHSVQYSFVMNYDLGSGKELKLANLFKPRSKYLEFISRYCMHELSKGTDHGSDFIFKDALAPIAENYDSWNVTRDGIRFNFDACRVFGCAKGEQKVEIPFAALKEILNPERPGNPLARGR